MTEPLRAPFPWFGGKSRAAHLIWPRLGDVPNYVEPFAGSLAVLLARPHPPRIETVNDLDAHLANFWRAIVADHDAVARWADWPVSEVDLHARHQWLVTTGAERITRLRTDPDYYDAQVAGWWVWGISLWIGSGWCSRPMSKKIPYLKSEGQGIRSTVRGQIPYLSSEGQGVHSTTRRQIPSIHHMRGVLQTTSPAPWIRALSDRLRHVRIINGDWRRVLTPAVTTGINVTGVLLDPPYGHDERQADIYAEEHDVAADVAAWAIEHGNDPNLRIALCGYEGEHVMPSTWSVARWSASGGYGARGEGRALTNRHRERIWFSPHCLPVVVQTQLFEEDQ